jgi:hypothetical protein
MAESPTFGWAESPKDHKWHRIHAASALGSEPPSAFHSACGEMFDPSGGRNEMPTDLAVCEECREEEKRAQQAKH